jgi:hypothetical protein
MRRHVVSRMAGLIFILAGSQALAQRMPQDTWYAAESWGPAGTGPGQFGAKATLTMDCATNGLIFIADSVNDRINVFSPTGQFISAWATADQPVDVACSPSGIVYVIARGPNTIQAFSTNGTLLRQWGGFGSATGLFNTAIYLDVAEDGRIYVADNGNYRIQVFNPDGSFDFCWGQYGLGPSDFQQIQGIEVGPDRCVYVRDHTAGKIKVFDMNGTFLRQWSVSFSHCSDVEVTPDGLIVVGNGWREAQICIYEPDGSLVKSWDGLGDTYGYFADFGISRDGTIYQLKSSSHVQTGRVQAYRRTFRTLSLTSTNALPQPAFITVQPRLGTTYIDVDYRITDADNSTVTVAALAFVNGSNNLGSVVLPRTWVEGTAGNIGEGVPANVTHRITWNIGADWTQGCGFMEMEILAKDRPGLVDVHYITIPSNGSSPSLTISRSPLTHNDFLSCWYWLLATSNAAINLASGKVYGAGGAYDAKILAQGTNTTTDGRMFLYDCMGVREATSAEVSRVRIASTPGITNSWTPRFQIGPGELPKALNEYGFDTGNWGTSVWWVVSTNLLTP